MAQNESDAPSCLELRGPTGLPLHCFDEVDWTAETTLGQIVAAWGEPYRDGPANEMFAYYSTSGERLWLSFSPEEPRRLTRAILLSNSLAPTSTVLFNELEITKTRRRDQLDFLRPTSSADVFAVWGPPDGVWGSGLIAWVYTFSNGETMSVTFYDDLVMRSDPRARNRQRNHRSRGDEHH